MNGPRCPGHVTLEVAATKASRGPDLQAGQVPAGYKVIDRAATDVQKPCHLFHGKQAFCQGQRTQVVCLEACTEKSWPFLGGNLVQVHRRTSGLFVRGFGGDLAQESFYRTCVLASKTKLSTAYRLGVMLFVTPSGRSGARIRFAPRHSPETKPVIGKDGRLYMQTVGHAPRAPSEAHHILPG